MTPFLKLMLYGGITALLWCILCWFNLLPWFFVWLLLFFIILRLVLGAIDIQQNFYLPSINSLADVGIDASEKKICLTFDDGIHETRTPRVLDILRDKEVQAMFFLIGKNCENQKDILFRLQQEGHRLGNHSYAHDFWFDMKSSQAMYDDIQHTQQLMQDTIQFAPKFFRPPYGVTNPNLAKTVKRTGLTSVGWNLRSLDTVAKSSSQLLEKLKKDTKPNAIVLLHDRCEYTVEVLTEYIDYCLAQGYTFVLL